MEAAVEKFDSSASPSVRSLASAASVMTPKRQLGRRRLSSRIAPRPSSPRQLPKESAPKQKRWISPLFCRQLRLKGIFFCEYFFTKKRPTQCQLHVRTVSFLEMIQLAAAVFALRRPTFAGRTDAALHDLFKAALWQVRDAAALALNC